MSRHRNVRSMNYEDEYYDEDDMYGHSVEDNYCISPGTAAQFTFNRERNVALSNYMDEQGGIPEEDEGDDTDEGTPRTQHRSSLDYTRPKLTDVDEAKLNSVLEEVRNVIGEAVPEGVMVDTIMKHNFSVEGSLNELLNQQEAPKPQREPRRERRNRSQELDDETEIDFSSSFQDNVFSYIPHSLQGVMKFGESASPQSPSFLLQEKAVLDNRLVSGKNKEHCASGCHSIQCSSKISHEDVKNISQGTLKNCNAQDQKRELESNSGNENIQIGSQSQVQSLSHTDIKHSLSSLINMHGIRNKGTEQNVNKEEKIKMQQTLSGLAKKHCGSNVSPAAQQSQQSLSCVSGNHLHNNNSLSEMVKCNSDNSSCLLGPAESQSGSSLLSGLAKTQSSSSPLSGLAKAHTDNTSPLSGIAKAHLINTSPLSGLAKGHLHGTSPLSGLAKAQLNNTSPLSGLAKAHLDNTSPLSGLAKAHLDSTSPLTDLAKAQTSSTPGLAKTSLDNISPLSESAKTQLGSSPLSALAKADFKSSPVGMSLSQLAEAHGVKKTTVTTVREKNISENKENHDVLKPNSGSMLSFKNKGDKDQIMLSLSSLIEKHGTTETAGTNVNRSRKNEEAELGSQASASPKGLSLADLAKKKNPQVLKETKGIAKIKKTNLLLEGDDTKELSEAKKDVKSTNSAKVEFVDVDLIEEKFICLDDLQLEHFKNYLKDPSSIGNALSLKAGVKPEGKRRRKYKQKKFSYRCQMKGLREVLQVEMSKIKPFDFSTPSPDDIIKLKQKQAFNRNGK
ncbi:uncharacterized protein LOC132724560 isoform X1 [Ruditapes philippinarum]|uniref:uncharacterized protein LOC132724560 isoform X1 n=1 Tax=Ruditapes philippinarum TaxID=129788 RepID=UPI00295AF9BE|nr:uncharacterized protein LOC132724560 isoform X1 [Ruditapes philippinarum]